MTRRCGVVRQLISAAALVCSTAAGGQPATPGLSKLRWVTDIPLTGATTRFDYESVDPQKHLLFVAHLGDSMITVVDTKSQNVISDIPGVSHVHGVLSVPELGRAFATATKTNEVVVIDEATLNIVERIPAGIYPDGLAYAPSVHKLFVSDKLGASVSVIDTNSNQRVDTIDLDSVAGNSQYDPVSKHIFVNAQTRNQLVEINPDSNTIIARYDLTGANQPHGLLIEPTGLMAFVACEGNHTLLIFDLTTKRVAASFDVGKAPDVLAYDPGLRLLYVAGEEGIVSVFSTVGRRVQKIAEGLLAAHAHVVGVDPITHYIYFPLSSVNGRPVLRVMVPQTALDH
ncbi:MAG: YncE family protein [Gammaproteobacteria bacterium]|nr:YncE family protein [Gammaproteobacteria bacterium]